jgi:hypothetical protein
MSACASPYALSIAVRDVSFLSDSHVYKKIESLLMYHGGVGYLTGASGSRRSIAFDDIIRAVTCATIRWGKPYELLSARNIVEGKPESSIPKSDCSHRTIQRGLKELCANGLLLRFTANQGRNIYYALNLEKAMSILRGHVESRPARSSFSETARRLYSEIVNSEDFKKLVRIINDFAGRVIRDINGFLRELDTMANAAMCAVHEVAEKVRETSSGAMRVTRDISQKSIEIVQQYSESGMAKLLDIVKKGKMRAKETAMKKNASLAGRTIICDTGYIDSQAALALWHKEVHDTDRFPDYVVKNTPKIRGQMKHWLKELCAQDFVEADIRDLIHSCAFRWSWIVRRREKIPGVSREGRPYSVLPPSTPDFEFFYANRSAMIPLLRNRSAALAEAQAVPPPKSDAPDDGWKPSGRVLF